MAFKSYTKIDKNNIVQVSHKRCLILVCNLKVGKQWVFFFKLNTDSIKRSIYYKILV